MFGIAPEKIVEEAPEMPKREENPAPDHVNVFDRAPAFGYAFADEASPITMDDFTRARNGLRDNDLLWTMPNFNTVADEDSSPAPRNDRPETGYEELEQTMTRLLEARSGVQVRRVTITDAFPLGCCCRITAEFRIPGVGNDFCVHRLVDLRLPRHEAASNATLAATAEAMIGQANEYYQRLMTTFPPAPVHEHWFAAGRVYGNWETAIAPEGYWGMNNRKEGE